MEAANAKILICNESAEERRVLRDSLFRFGFKHLYEAENGERALDLISGEGIDTVITDLWLSKLDGIGLIRAASSMKGEDKPTFILLSPVNKHSILMEASEAGADLCLVKPHDPSALSSHVLSLYKMKKSSKAKALVVFIASNVYLCDHRSHKKRTKIHVRTTYTYTLLNRIYFAFDR
jgi:two-component system chemotaxis response regulator CheY